MRALLLLLGFFGAKLAFADTVIHGVRPGFKAGQPGAGVEYHTGLLKRPPSFKGDSLKVVDLKDDPACAVLPDSYEIPTAVIPPVKDQGQCGSCWSFSKSGAFESWLAVTGKAGINLAEQELVSDDGQNYGCDGGLLQSREYQYSNGQGLEADFPYTASDSRARSITPVGKIPVPQFEVVGGTGDAKVKGVQCGLYKYHTIPWITVGADNDWGSPPTADGAVWTRCSNNSTNHAIGITGWKTVGGKVYFHAKNSWGTSWGQKGYAWIALGCDGFGDEVAFLPASPTPSPGPGPGPGPTPVPFKCQSQLDAAGAAVDALKACVKAP